MKTETTPTYKKGSLVALRFVECPATPGIYVLHYADGKPHGAIWRPLKAHSMLLPQRMTVYATITAKTGARVAVTTPGELGATVLTLSAEELKKCDCHA